MFKIILTIITLALITTTCNHVKGNSKNYRFDYKDTPDHSLEIDNDLIVSEHPIAQEIPEPSLFFSYALISISCVMIKKK